ncbi:MAG: hypothetical protein ACXVYA_10275, partial [Mycobacterium sp.]
MLAAPSLMRTAGIQGDSVTCFGGCCANSIDALKFWEMSVVVEAVWPAAWSAAGHTKKGYLNTSLTFSPAFFTLDLAWSFLPSPSVS